MKLLHWLATLAFSGCLAAQTVGYTYDAAGRLTGVAYPNGKTLSYAYDSAGNLLQRLVRSAVAGPAPAATAAGVLNAASFQGGAVAPGELVTIFGSGIGPASLAGPSVTRFNFLDNFVGDATALFDGIPAAIYYVSAGQSSVFVPYSVAGKNSTQMVIEYQGRRSAPVTLPVAASAPGLFSRSQDGKGNGVMVNQDSSFNAADNPAAKGSIVAMYGTGEGQTNPAGVDGRFSGTVFPKPLLPVSVSIGGINAEIVYQGADGGSVAGVFQVNARIPDQVASGAVPVVVKVGNASSQAGLTVAVR